MEKTRDLEAGYGAVAMILRLAQDRASPIPEAMLVLADLEKQGPSEDLDFAREVVYAALADVASMLLIALAQMPGLEALKTPDHGVTQ